MKKKEQERFSIKTELVEDILKARLPKKRDFVNCSFILPDGKYLNLQDHYEAYNYLVINGLVRSMPDAEILLSDLGWIRYSLWARYITLPHKAPSEEQYKKIEEFLSNLTRISSIVTLQIQDNPRFYQNMDLVTHEDVEHIIKRIKQFYKFKRLFI